MSEKNKLAVLILTRNEEKNIEDCIKSASCADEVIVVDSGSTDATRSIAESLGAAFKLLHRRTTPKAEA